MADVAVVIPCLNEASTIGKVVVDFQSALPHARIYVFDNNSTDDSASIAEKAGAFVIPSPKRGKGSVVRHMFESVTADVYLMVDGDDTYPASAAPALIAEMDRSDADIVVGSRQPLPDNRERLFHRAGNILVSSLISNLFSLKLTDVMSGFRVMSSDFVRCVPLTSTGFEIESEITLQAAAKKFVIKEVPVPYRRRPQGSHSKLKTFSDGILVLKTIFIIFKDYRPFLFFTLLSALLMIISVLAGLPPIIEYIRKGFVYRVPLAIFATGTGILSAMAFSIGLILDTLSKYHNENFRQFRRIRNRSNNLP